MYDMMWNMCTNTLGTTEGCIGRRLQNQGIYGVVRDVERYDANKRDSVLEAA
jgi:hypothetical protein